MALPGHGGEYSQQTMIDAKKWDWNKPIKVMLVMDLQQVRPTQRFEVR